MTLVARRPRGADVQQVEAAQGDLPPLFVLFSAHNEAAVIRQRLENLDGVDYPRDRMRVLVGIDGGEDKTAEIARRWSETHSYVRVHVSDHNQGKASMLKRLVAQVEPGTAGVLVFTDANTMFAPEALRVLAARFADPKVGGVCGRLVFAGQASHPPASPSLHPPSSAPRQTDEPVYWDIETRMKMAESGLDSCLGANGAIYAIRAGLFPSDFADNTIVDDFVIGMKVREQGYRMVYETGAIAYEEAPGAVTEEWRRRVRIGAGAYQALVTCRRCLLPRYGVFAWMFWSHKVLRWFTPHLLVGWLTLYGLWLLGVGGSGGETWPIRCGSPFSAGSLALGLPVVIACLAGGIGWLVGTSGWRWAVPFRLANYFLVMQAALLVGFVRFCRGDLSGSWRRTARG
jgi:cellulose synthase/poly-beta-1,6-N-acetylglucosamine synthase-like glycosyltransferase